MLSIGPHKNNSKVILAPMAGVTDRPYRDCCRRYGTYWAVSEMMTSNPKLWSSWKSKYRMPKTDEIGPRWVQIAGSEPTEMAAAAAACADMGAQIVDINMGCPAKKVCNKAAGSALLRDEKLVKKILSAVTDSVSVPVTLKIRLGWSKKEMNGIRIAEMAQKAGVKLVTVHGRTRECRFSGNVDYKAVAEIKKQVEIPIVVNGDIRTPQEAKQILGETECDAVMIGRAALGKPWLPAQVDSYLKTGKLGSLISVSDVIFFLVRHVKALHQYYGLKRGLLIARKHVGWAVDGLPAAALFRKRFNRAVSGQEQLMIISCLDKKEWVV